MSVDIRKTDLAKGMRKAVDTVKRVMKDNYFPKLEKKTAPSDPKKVRRY